LTASTKKAIKRRLTVEERKVERARKQANTDGLIGKERKKEKTKGRERKAERVRIKIGKAYLGWCKGHNREGSPEC
jgi:hypothetical protein